MEEHSIDERVLAETQRYLAEAMNRKLTKGRDLNGFVYACLYLAFRKLEYAVTIGQVVELSGVEDKRKARTRIEKTYRLLIRSLNLDVPLVDPVALMKSRSKMLHVSRKTLKRSISILQKARKDVRYSGRSPLSLAASSLSLACEEEKAKPTDSQIVEAFEVSKTTLDNLTNMLRDALSGSEELCLQT